MEEKYLNLIKSFSNLDIDDKKEEILKNMYELLELLYFTNKKIDKFNNVLPVLNDYYDDDEYFNKLFTYVISLKEECAKAIDKINYNE